MHVYLDIETIPGQSPQVLARLEEEQAQTLAELKAPANYKDPAKIAAWIEEARANLEARREERWRRTALDALDGELFCAAAAVDAGDTVTFARSDIGFPPAGSAAAALDEADALLRLFGWLAHIGAGSTPADPLVLVAHNGNGFDFPFLWRRAVLLGVRPPPWYPAPDEIRAWRGGAARQPCITADTMVTWTGSPKDHVKLDTLARALGLRGKGEIDGSQVWDYVRDGRGEEVVRYCAHDIRMLREVHRRLRFLGVAA
jgi:hypothetical protein